MPTARPRRYRHFPTIPDALALMTLLRQAAIAFETRYERGTNYDRARHEPDRLEVWLRAADYAYVQRLEAALTREQALALATATLPANQWNSIVAQAAPRPPDDRTTARNIPAHQTISHSSAAISSIIILRRWLFGLLTLSGLAALVFYWLR